MPDSSMKRGATLCLAPAIGPDSTLADDSLGRRDSISTGLNQRQKAEMKVSPDFVEGSTLNGFLRNYYFARDNHDTPSHRDQREQVQGLMPSFRPGYTDMLIGIGLDAHAFYGLCLDGDGDSGGIGVLSLDPTGHPADGFSATDAALKPCGLDSLLKIGSQSLESPMTASGVNRVAPQGYRGVTLKNHHFRALELDTGFVEAIRLCNQSGHSHLTSGYGNSTRSGITTDRENPYIAWLGTSYSAPGGSQATLYNDRLEDIWNRHYLGLSQPWRLSSQLTLMPWLHYYKTRDQGHSQLGRIDDDPHNVGLTLAGGGQLLGLGLQKADGNTPFNFIAQNDRTLLYESNVMQYADFNDPDERSREVQYQTSLAFLVTPDWQFGVAHGRGRVDLTRVDPDSMGYGYLYNLNGKNTQHWERGLSLRCALPAGPAKGLSVTLRQAIHHPGEDYTVLGNARSNPSSDEYRMVVDYLIRLLQTHGTRKKGNSPMRAALLPTFNALPATLYLEAHADVVMLSPLAPGNVGSMDGVSCPGMPFELLLQYVRVNNVSDADGRSVPGQQRVCGTTPLPHSAYLSQSTLLGTHYDAEVLLLLIRLDLDIDGGPDGRRTRQGDLIVGPLMLQWGPVTLLGRPYWQCPNFVFPLPTGDYDKDATINTGSNTWIFNPRYALTWGLGERLELNGRLHYAWISRNDDPPPRLDADDVQPEQALYANSSISYMLDPRWRIGLAGYQSKQASTDRINGHRQADPREQVFGIGPGVTHSQGRRTLPVNLCAENGARSRSEGNQLALRYLLAL